MPPAQKAPAPKKPAAGSRPVTASGHVVTPARPAGPKNGNGNGATSKTKTPSQPATRGNGNGNSNGNGKGGTRNWWEDAGDINRMSERDRKRLSAAAHAKGDDYHAIGDFFYRPDLAPDADRPTGRPSRLPDERLYGGSGTTRQASTGSKSTSNGNGSKVAAKPANGRAKVSQAKPKTTVASTKARGR